MCNCNTGSDHDHDHGYGPGTAILCGVIFAVMTTLITWNVVRTDEERHEKEPHHIAENR